MIEKGLSEKVTLDESTFDPCVNLKDDFYSFANKKWMEENPLPNDFSRFGVFDKVHEKSIAQRKELITKLSEHPDANVMGTDAQKIRDIYELGMDVDRLNKEGAAPLRPFLDKIENANLSQLEDLIAWLHTGITSTFFTTGVGPDQRNSNKYLMNIGYAGLGLGDRDYYLVDNEENRRYIAAYEKFVKTLMTLSGYDEESAQRIWNNVIEIETKFAENRKTKEMLRDPDVIFNIMTYSDFKKRYSNFNWDAYFSAFGVEKLDEINVIDPEFIDFINNFLPTLDSRKLKDLLIYDLVADCANLLSEEFEDTVFDLYGKAMNGTEEKQPRWKRIMAVPNSLFGEIVGKLYVEKYFPEENKQYMVQLVENLRKALALHIKSLPWMSEETKRKALEKLDSLTIKIGYPDKWKDYSEINIDPSKSFFENIHAANVWFTHDNYSKINKPVDKTEWLMTPQAVNAYYNPTSNEICFPAGILQPPFFDINAEDAINYGRIGVVIGHEMTHGFDDRGRKYDKDGNLADWWTAEDSKQFNELAESLVAQFSKVEVAPGIFANGKYTLGENIADQGGLRVAMTALRMANEDNIDSNVKSEYSPEQVFYLAYANVWAENIRPESIAVRTKSDTHSLGRIRVNATLRNLDSFIEAFEINEGDAMFLPKNERIIIW